MSFNYENRRELAANRSYQASVLAKRDLLAQRIKKGNKTTEIDISKVLEGIKNGDLSVLEELDRAGISYTLTNNGQAFDGKSDDDYYFACEYNGTTYTAEHKALTREQEEAKKKSEASVGRSAAGLSFKKASDIPFISISKAVDIMEGAGVQRVNEDPKPAPVQEPAPAEENNGTTTVTEVNINNLLNNAVYATAEPANTTVTATSETTQGTVSTTSTDNSTTVAVDKNKADALLEELKNAMLSADAKVYVDHGVTNVEQDKALAFVNTFAPKMTEIFMTKYGYTKEFAQILTDAIIEKSFWDNYDRVGAKRLNRLATEDNVMDPDCETTVKTYDTAKILQSVLGYMNDTDSIVYHGNTPEDSNWMKSFGRLLEFYKGGYHFGPGRATHCKDVAANANNEYSNNDFKILDVILERYWRKLFPELADNGQTSPDDPNNIINKTIDQVRHKLEQLLNHQNYWVRNNSGSGCFPVERLDELDKDGNGYLDDLFKIVQDTTALVQNEDNYNVAKAILDIKEYAGYSYVSDGYAYSNLINMVKNAGINYIENTNMDNNGYTTTISFTFDGIDYTVSERYNSEKADTRSIDEVTDEQLEEYLQEQTLSSANDSIYWAIMLGEECPYEDSNEFNVGFSHAAYNHMYEIFMNYMRIYPDDIYTSIYGNQYACEIYSYNFDYLIGQVLQKEYGITKESSNEEIHAKLKEYFTSLGLDLSLDIPWEKGTYYAKETLKDSFIAIRKDLMNRFPGYKNQLKEDYLAITNPNRESQEYSISSKPSENKYDNNSPESVLEFNLKTLMENPNFFNSNYIDNIEKCLDQLNIKYNNLSGLLHFSYNGLDYEITLTEEEKYIENPRTIDDVTEEDINKKLSLFGWGNDYTFWNGKWNDCPWFPEYDENWEEHYIDYLLESYYDNCPYHGNNSGASAIEHICTNYLIDILRDKCGIEDYTASKEANLAALTEYLKSIDAYTRDDKLDRTTIEWTKVYRILYDENPKFKKLIDKWAMGDTLIYNGSDQHVIIRTRPSEGNNDIECPDELRDDLNLAIAYREQFEFDFTAKVGNATKKAYSKTENWDEYTKIARDIYKENMIYVCNVLSYIPEYKRIIEELFGSNYIDAITTYCQTADFHNINCSASSNPKSMNPIYLLFDKIEEYIKQSQDPNNKNGYTDVYYK